MLNEMAMPRPPAGGGLWDLPRKSVLRKRYIPQDAMVLSETDAATERRSLRTGASFGAATRRALSPRHAFLEEVMNSSLHQTASGRATRNGKIFSFT